MTDCEYELISTSQWIGDTTHHLFVRRQKGPWYWVRGIRVAYVVRLKIDHLGFDRFINNYCHIFEPQEPTT